MLSFFGFNKGVSLSKGEASYFNNLIDMLEQVGKTKVELSLTIGAIFGFVPGFIVGGVVGFGMGCLSTWEHTRMLSTLRGMSEGEKVRIVAVVQGVVGGSSDITQVVKFINDGKGDKLLKALKENLSTSIV